VARAEAYLRAKFDLDPSNRLATVHERHRQTGQTGQTGQDRQRPDSIGRTILQTVAEKLANILAKLIDGGKLTAPSDIQHKNTFM